jgi:hypothetical protein
MTTIFETLPPRWGVAVPRTPAGCPSRAAADPRYIGNRNWLEKAAKKISIFFGLTCLILGKPALAPHFMYRKLLSGCQLRQVGVRI